MKIKVLVYFMVFLQFSKHLQFSITAELSVVMKNTYIQHFNYLATILSGISFFRLPPGVFSGARQEIFELTARSDADSAPLLRVSLHNAGDLCDAIGFRTPL